MNYHKNTKSSIPMPSVVHNYNFIQEHYHSCQFSFFWMKDTPLVTVFIEEIENWCYSRSLKNTMKTEITFVSCSRKVNVLWKDFKQLMFVWKVYFIVVLSGAMELYLLYYQTRGEGQKLSITSFINLSNKSKTMIVMFSLM